MGPYKVNHKQDKKTNQNGGKYLQVKQLTED